MNYIRNVREVYHSAEKISRLPASFFLPAFDGLFPRAGLDLSRLAGLMAEGGAQPSAGCLKGSD